MSLVALVLGAVGVAMAMRAHLQQRLDTIAIMKSLGARSGQIMKIYMLQTLLLGLAGGVFGVLLGMGVQLAFPLFLAKLLHITPDFRVDPRSIRCRHWCRLANDAALHPATTTRHPRHPPHSDSAPRCRSEDDPFVARLIRKLRGNVAQNRRNRSHPGRPYLPCNQRCRFGQGWRRLLCCARCCFANSARHVGADVIFAAALPAQNAFASALVSASWPRQPLSARQSSSALLAALGLGVMLIMSVYFIQQAAVRELNIFHCSKPPQRVPR